MIRPVHILPVIFLAFLSGAVVVVKAHRATPQVVAAAPANEREAWAIDLLEALGNTQPTAETVAMVVEWTIAEDGGDGAMARGNPLNTTMPSHAENAIINDDGVRGYTDWQAGIQATVATIENGLYEDLRAALLANDPEAAKRALWASPWAESHYGYGADWPAYTTPAVSLPQGRKAPVTNTMIVYAYFGSRDCGSWGFQLNCQHWGTDFIGAEGDPVYAPFDLTIIDIGAYGPGPTWGQYVQGTFPDGSVFYSGHLKDMPAMSVGETIPAGSVIGYMNAYAHTHVQFAGPGNTGACAQDGSCLDFEVYWGER